MNYNLTMKLLGYYSSEKQFMKPETRFPDEVVQLATLFKKTFDETFTEDMLSTINPNRSLDFIG